MSKDAKALEMKKANAVGLAFWATKLMDPKYFDKASKAIANKDKKALLKVCDEAGIPKEVISGIREDYATEGWGWGWG